MQRNLACSLIVGGLIILLSVTSAAAAEEAMAKVYRDYPAYIESPTCENPNLRTAQSGVPAGDGSVTTGHYYLLGWAGVSALGSTEYDFEGGGGLDVEYDDGYAAGAAFGYDFGAWRLELEAAYRTNNLDKLELDGGPDISGDGDVDITTVLLNAYYDIETNSPATPYFGAGVGWANVDLKNIEGDDIEIIDDSDGVWAAQAGVGVLFAFSRNLALDLGYRFLLTDDPELKGPGGADVETEVRSHTIMAGLQVRF